MAEQVDKLTITVAGKGGKDILVSSLVRVLKESFQILKDLDRSGNLRWRVREASMKSPFRAVFVAELRSPNKPYDPQISKRYVDLFNALEGGSELPPSVDITTARRARRLVDVLNDGVVNIEFESPYAKPISPSQRVQARVQELEQVTVDPYAVFTTLEGNLDTVSIRFGQDRFMLFDRVTGQETECVMTKQEQMDNATELVKTHRSRVRVRGFVAYESGRPKRIQVESFTPMPTNDELPPEDALRGIDITGGEDSVSYVRKMRDAQ